MCLYINEKLTKKKLKSKKEVHTFYKRLVIHNNVLMTPYQNFKIHKSGTQTIPQNEELVITSYSDGIRSLFGGAFHLYTHKTKAYYDEVVIPVQVKKEDIIYFGSDYFDENDQVTVHAYTISKRTWNKIFKKEE